MKDKKFFSRENYICLLSIPLILSGIIFFYSRKFGLLGLLFTFLTYLYLNKVDSQSERKVQNFVDELDLTSESITKNVVFQMPFPILILQGRTIRRHNSNFKDLVSGDILIGRDIGEILPELADLDLSGKKNNPVKLAIGEGKYLFYYKLIEKKDEEDLLFLYGIDNTQDEKIKQIFKDKRLVIFTIYIDNYDDIRNSTDMSSRSVVFGDIDQTLRDYFSSYQAVIRKYENDRYICLMEHASFEKIYDGKFEILDIVRNIESGNDLPPTLSIGVGFAGENPTEIYDDSRTAIDLALSRGGDQAVVKIGDSFEYFGGKTRAIEKSSKVRSRVVAHSIRRIIDLSQDVYIMGHANPDMDSFGSAIGMYEAARSRGKKAYLVLNEVTKPIENIYDRTVEQMEDLKDNIITGSEALSRISSNSLIIVTDNHRRNSTEEPRLLEKSDQLIIIDHHRRGNDYLREATISYIEPYASSASELVTEILSYFDENFKARISVAEALLAGITVDTKNFVYRTGARTFQAAALLKRWGADSQIIVSMFKDDYEIVKYKSEVIVDSKIIFDIVAIGRFNRDIDGSSLIASQAADDLLTVKDVKASFVLTPANGRIHISGRSSGDISVQLILERIGGGGHMTMAATQLDMSMEDAEKILIKAIKEYLEEEYTNESNINR